MEQRKRVEGDRENEGTFACGCGEAKEEHMNRPSDTLLSLLLFLEKKKHTSSNFLPFLSSYLTFQNRV